MADRVCHRRYIPLPTDTYYLLVTYGHAVYGLRCLRLAATYGYLRCRSYLLVTYAYVPVTSRSYLVNGHAAIEEGLGFRVYGYLRLRAVPTWWMTMPPSKRARRWPGSLPCCTRTCSSQVISNK